MSSSTQPKPLPSVLVPVLLSCTKATALIILVTSGILNTLAAQEPWYTIELSIFTNESRFDREQEHWQADRITLGYPPNIRRLKELTDILLISELLPEPPVTEAEASSVIDTTGFEEEFVQQTAESIPSENELRAKAIREVGPHQVRAGEPFEFYDFDRDSYLTLPVSASDFTQTNRALRRSPEHRLLYHRIWNQPVVGKAEAPAIIVEGGERYGGQAELQGSLTIRFNDNADRVVLDANIWLSEFILDNTNLNMPTEPNGSPDTETSLQTTDLQWQLPDIPDTLNNGPLQILQAMSQTDGQRYRPGNVFPMQQSRAMRSNEFHYLHHPALGIVVIVQPYEVPVDSLPDNLDLDDSAEINSETDITESDETGPGN